MKNIKFLIIFLLLFIPLYFVNADGEEEVVEEINLLPYAGDGNNNSLVLSWETFEGVVEFQLYRSTKSNSGFKKIATLKTNMYTDKKLVYGTKYYYKVKAVFSNKSVTSDVFSKKVLPNKVTKLVLKPGNNKVKISFGKTNNNGYEIYSSTDQVKWTKIATITKNKTTNYTNKKLKANKIYYYKVRAYQIVKKKKVYGPFSDVASALTYPASPSITLKATAYNEITVNINKVGGATYYEVQRSTDNKKFSFLSSTENLSFVDNTVTPTVKYYYKVRACNTESKCGGYSKVLNVKTSIKKPTLNGSAQVTKVNLNWNEINYASGYEAYYSTNKDKNYSKISSGSELTITKTGLTPGKTYYFKVRTYVVKDSKKYYSGYSNILTLKPGVKKVGGLNLTPNSKSIKLDWNESIEATGYEVYMTKNKKDSYKKIATVSETTFENTGLKENTTYYYKVRALIKLGKKAYYGPYSDVVSAKTLESVKEIDYTNVMQKAQSIVTHFHNDDTGISRVDLKNELYYYHFSKEEVEYAISNVDVNWREECRGKATNLINGAYSEQGMINLFREEEYTSEEIEYAMSNQNFDFNQNAVRCALEHGYSFSEEGLRRYLLGEFFTAEEVNYAMSQIEGEFDYAENARDIASSILYENKSRQEIIDELSDLFFSEDEINYAMVVTNDANFSEFAFYRAFENVYINNTRAKTEAYLRECKFTDEEIEYAVNLLFKEITSTIDLINLNDPIVVYQSGRGTGCSFQFAFKNQSDIDKIPAEFVNKNKHVIYNDDGFNTYEFLSSVTEDVDKTNQIITSLRGLSGHKGIGNVAAERDMRYVYNEQTGEDEEIPMGFVYGVSELELANEDFYGNFGVAFSSMYEEIDNEIDQVLSDSYLIQGACGDYNPPVRLTEELCNEYHLTCNRW